jgi:hypothetical protein
VLSENLISHQERIIIIVCDSREVKRIKVNERVKERKIFNERK